MLELGLNAALVSELPATMSTALVQSITANSTCMKHQVQARA